jgi:uncharacterized protein (TIGR00251 family)
MIYEKKGDKIVLNIKAQPNSSKNKIAGVYADALKVNIKAPAVEGAANKELIKFFSKEFKIPKSEIEIKGQRSKKKQLVMPVNERLIQFLESLV